MTTPQDLELVKPEKISSPLWKEDNLEVTDEFIGFPISLKRMAITLICFALFFELHSLFLLYWRCMHFRPFLRSGTTGNFANLICAVFFPFSFFKLAAVYDERANNRQIDLKMHEILLPASYLVISSATLIVPLTWYLFFRDGAHLSTFVPYIKLAILPMLIPLFIFQHKVNKLNRALLPDKPFNPPITRLEEGAIAAAVVIGIGWRALSGQF